MNRRVLTFLTSAAPLLALAATVSCAPSYEDVPVKMVGIGYDPDEIGPSPTPYGGVVEYSWVNFTGGGLSLALMGLGSFDEVGPNMGGFAPPYAAVYGFSYIFSQKLASADSLAGVTSVPPEVDDTCYTTFDAGGPLGSFNTVDIGSWMEFRTLDENHEGGIRFDRTPRDYPSNKENVFVYYLGFDFWSQQASYSLIPTADTNNNPGSLAESVLRTRTFPHGEEVEFRFPGAIALSDAPIASVPRPSAAIGNTSYVLPTLPGGVQVEWSGPRYDTWGNPLETEAALQQTCLAYAAPSIMVPENAAACDGADAPDTRDYIGQMYTGPWDADDGKVTFRWTPGTSQDEFVSISVRFLGKVDRNDPAFLEHVVAVTPDETATSEWNGAQRNDYIPGDREISEGRRAPLPSEQGQWVFDDAYQTATGDLVPALRGDPFHNVAELTCRMKDDGEYTLTADQLEDALIYARRHEAEGAIFFFARSTEAEAAVPPAKDQYNQKLDITPVKLTSRAIDIGRFWYEE